MGPSFTRRSRVRGERRNGATAFEFGESFWVKEKDSSDARSRAVLALHEMIKLEDMEREFELKQQRKRQEQEERERREAIDRSRRERDERETMIERDRIASEVAAVLAKHHDHDHNHNHSRSKPSVNTSESDGTSGFAASFYAAQSIPTPVTQSPPQELARCQQH